MSTEAMSKERFIEITQEEQWSTIEQYLERLDDNDFWTREFEVQALAIAKKDYIRRTVRGIKDESGWPIIASIVTTDEDGEEVRVYKQEHLFNLEDYKQVATYHQERGRYHMKTANGYVERANARFGKQLALPFPGASETD